MKAALLRYSLLLAAVALATAGGIAWAKRTLIGACEPYAETCRTCSDCSHCRHCHADHGKCSVCWTK